MSLRHSIAQSAGDVISMLRTRVELFSVEFGLEKTRFFKLLGLAATALVFLLLAALVATLLLIVLFWDTPHRLLAIGVIAACYALIGLGLILAISHHLKAGSLPFSATVQELERDVQMLSNFAHEDEQGHRGDHSYDRDRL